MGKVRAAEQENGAITLASGKVVTAFRFNSTGTLHATFTPSIEEPSMSATDVVLGVRPDGRILYATTTTLRLGRAEAALQQTMPDGTPDLDFGAGGKIVFSLFSWETLFNPV